jgi:hypothetical protein
MERISSVANTEEVKGNSHKTFAKITIPYCFKVKRIALKPVHRLLNIKMKAEGENILLDFHIFTNHLKVQ